MLPLHLILIFAILTFAFTIFLTDGKLFLLQLVLALGLLFTKDSSAIVQLVGGLQLILLVFALYRCKKAIDYDFHLVLEKTHLAPKNLTKDGKIGGDVSIFKKNY